MSSDRAVLLYTTRTLTCATIYHKLHTVIAWLFCLIVAPTRGFSISSFAEGGPQSGPLCGWLELCRGCSSTNFCRVPINRKPADTAATCSLTATGVCSRCLQAWNHHNTCAPARQSSVQRQALGLLLFAVWPAPFQQVLCRSVVAQHRAVLAVFDTKRWQQLLSS
jgi:hypothetical protein